MVGRAEIWPLIQSMVVVTSPIGERGGERGGRRRMRKMTQVVDLISGDNVNININREIEIERLREREAVIVIVIDKGQESEGEPVTERDKERL